ncbi:MAG: type II toxin-antitoxin system VapC family toxin [Cocleimonas sp.]
MNYLLDTHTFIWWLENSKKLSKPVRNIIGNSDNRIFVSHASQWEIAIKVAIDRLAFPVKKLEDTVEENGFELLALNTQHIMQTVKLPMHHRDPFDRLLIAQAQIETLILLSKDQWFDHYDVKLDW